MQSNADGVLHQGLLILKNNLKDWWMEMISCLKILYVHFRDPNIGEFKQILTDVYLTKFQNNLKTVAYY